MYTIKLIVLTGIFLFINGCTGTGAATGTYQLFQTDKDLSQQTVTVSDRSIEYRILTQDRLQISLYKDPQSAAGGGVGTLGQSMNPSGILVDASGYVPLPLIGKIKLVGLTQTQAADSITKAYKKYLNTPSVYVEVLNKKIIVLGEVGSPGVKALRNEKMNLFEALALSGDFKTSAVKDQVVIISNSRAKGMQMRIVDMTNFDTMNYASLMLRPNDIVYVRPNGWQEFKVGSSDVLSLLDPILKVAGTYASFKYLAD